MKVCAEEGWTQKYAALRWREATDLEVCVNLQRKGGEDSGSGCYVEHGGCWTVGGVCATESLEDMLASNTAFKSV